MSIARGVRQAFAKDESEFIPFYGGFDVVTPPLSRKTGTLRSAQNYEADVNGGYRRIVGYERFDGQAAPSAATYTIFDATITGAPAVGNTLTGLTSGASGVIIVLPGGQFVLTKVTGTFQNGETVQVSAVSVGTITSAPTVNGASTALLDAQYKNAAADNYRADIAAVPGSGNILGGFYFNNVNYAFRANSGGTAVDLYKSTAAGWTQVAFEYEVTFSSGSGASDIVDGGTLTQGAVTATIRRVVVKSGSLSGGTAAGTLVISAPSGGNFAAGAATVGGAGTLTLAGAESAITLSTGGLFETTKANFGGSANTTRVYGCDGVNPGWEFDGSYFVPIHTGMTTDAPQHVGHFKNHLFFSFIGSAQHSGPGTPFVWSPVLGAAELAMGDSITGLRPEAGGTTSGSMIIFCRNRTGVLYGNSSADWVLNTYDEEYGAIEWTIQRIGFTMQLDDRGLTSLLTSQKYGNFENATFSRQVKTWLNQRKTIVTDSCLCRDKNQYRLFFSDGYGMWVTFDGEKIVGIMPMLFTDTVRKCWSTEANDGSEVIFFGDSSGFVYQMEKGTSFDGDAIDSVLELAYNFSKSPRVEKTYRNCTFEITGSGYTSFNFSYSLGYGDTNIQQPAAVTLATSFSAVYWDQFTWDTFVWDGQTLAPSSSPMAGTAENVSLAIRSSSDYYPSYVLTGALIVYSKRKLIR